MSRLFLSVLTAITLGENLGELCHYFFFLELHSLWETHRCYQTPPLFELLILLWVSSPSKLIPNLISSHYSKSKYSIVPYRLLQHKVFFNLGKRSPRGSAHVLATLRSLVRPKLGISIRSSQVDCLIRHVIGYF